MSAVTDPCPSCGEHPDVARLFEPLSHESLAWMREQWQSGQVSTDAQTDRMLSLLSSDEWCSTEQIAAALGVTRHSVSSYAMAARRRGAKLRSQWGRGYRLEAVS